MTKHNTLKCPHCHKELDIDAVMAKQIEDKVLSEYNKKELELINREKELEAKQKQAEDAIKTQVELLLADERKKILETAKKNAEEKLALELQYTKTQAEEAKKNAEESKKQELEQRKKLEELEEYKRNQELETQRKVDEERKKAQEYVQKLADERLKAKDDEYKLILAEKDKQLELTKQSAEEAIKRANQGSMQIQGVVQENSLKEVLQRAFPVDRIEDVPTGMRGADIVQKVNNHYGQSGIILWESKNTKEWSNEWVNKLKEDMKLINADMGIIITRVMPRDMENFGNIDGIWVSEPRFAIPLANILRTQIEAIKESKQALVGQGTKMEAIYEYLLSTKFKNHMVSIITAFETMQDDLNKEKKAIQKQWSKRQTQLDRALAGSTSLYGDLQGIIGKSLPEIEELELDAGDKKLLKGDDDE